MKFTSKRADHKQKQCHIST